MCIIFHRNFAPFIICHGIIHHKNRHAKTYEPISFCDELSEQDDEKNESPSMCYDLK